MRGAKCTYSVEVECNMDVEKSEMMKGGSRARNMEVRSVGPSSKLDIAAVAMEVDQESIDPEPGVEQRATTLDSDDETLRFDKDDDLYDSGLDEDDARWVRRQHRPAAECGGEFPAEVLEDDHRSQDEDRGSSIGLPPEVAKNVDLEDDQDDKDHEGGHKVKKGKGKGSDDLGVESDAQLSCPLCFTTVCLECQRHARYLNQFRAVTGINVTVDRNESLRFEDISGGGKKRSKRGGTSGWNSGRQQESPQRRQGEDGPQEERELFHPVCCAECDHRVGVLDEEDVFHFFGVIASG